MTIELTEKQVAILRELIEKAQWSGAILEEAVELKKLFTPHGE